MHIYLKKIPKYGDKDFFTIDHNLNSCWGKTFGNSLFKNFDDLLSVKQNYTNWIPTIFISSVAFKKRK